MTSALASVLGLDLSFGEGVVLGGLLVIVLGLMLIDTSKDTKGGGPK